MHRYLPDMLRRISRLDWRGSGALFAAVESLAVSVLILLAVYVLWDAEFIGIMFWHPALALIGGLLAYWALQVLGHDRVAFWLLALAAALPHAAPAWSHNRIEWHVLLEFQENLTGDRSVYWDLTLFIVCLIVLILLHRTMGIKRLERWMLLQQVNSREKDMVVRYESVMLIVLIAAGLLVASLIAATAVVLSRYDELVQEPSLAIAVIGGGAAVLLALTLLVWFRSLRSSHNEDGGIRSDAVERG